MFIYSRRCFTLPQTSSLSDSEFNSRSKGENMNEPQDNILEDESSLNFRERNQGENKKIGMSKTSPLRKTLLNYVTGTTASKILQVKKQKN